MKPKGLLQRGPKGAKIGSCLLDERQPLDKVMQRPFSSDPGWPPCPFLDAQITNQKPLSSLML
jgi:hypothetical protein